MIELGLLGTKTGFEGKLSEGQAEELIKTTEALNLVVATVAVRTPGELVQWQKIHELREDGSPLVR